MVESGPSGRFGRRGLPLIALFSVVLPLLGPLLDLLTVYGTFFLNRWITAIGWLAVLVLQTITAVLAGRRLRWQKPRRSGEVAADVPEGGGVT
jgi:hypothetical protein